MVEVKKEVKKFEKYVWNEEKEKYMEEEIEVEKVKKIMVKSLGEKMDLEDIIDEVERMIVKGYRQNVKKQIYGVEKREELEN